LKKVELLAPAKNLKAIKAGLKYADSFYFGARQFNMRMKADNFSPEDLSKAVKLVHDNGKKVFLVTNILIYENELDLLAKHLENAKKLEFDAVILHDISAIEYAKDIGIPFHISTQANISNSASAKFYEKLGAERLILARECSLKQIKEIKSKLTKAEIEVFVHGAMCSSISGRCYFSMDVCGSSEFSANRGRCVQPCRRQWKVIDEENNEFLYDGQRFINSRDLCMIEFIPEIIDAGIDAMKIEGRMREPHYVEVVTKIYREAIDEYYNGNFSINSKKKVGKWIFELKKVYNRGFTNGFYFNRPTEKDQQHKSPTNLSHWRLIKMGSVVSYSNRDKKAKIILNNGILRRGMEILIQGGHGSDSNTYLRQKVYFIEINGKRVNSTPKANEKKPITIKIKVNKPVSSGKKDEIFLFTDKTYKRRLDKKTKKKNDYYKL
jgi:putative protease